MKKIMDIMQRIVQCTGAAGSMRGTDMEEKFELLVEANDILLDRANVCMDDEAGIPRKPGVQLVVSQTKKNIFGSWNTSSSSPKPSQAANSAAAIRLLAGKNVQRPQISFKDKIDNSTKPWVPRISDKPNALKPLGIYLVEGDNGEVFCHPYEFELDRFTPSDAQLQKKQPELYKSLEDTPLIVIEKPQDLKIMMEDLGKYDEIAIDLEHHSYRTFQGITCLMQVSTRDTDYLIDTITLRSELYILNEVFTKPTTLKVFHGADLDIQWLQRDLSLYIVNMFDTHQAAKQLNLPYLSLAYLMKTHCGVDPNKHFQLADWRMRPLPEELMKYAREDTHYLLYIKDILRNSLIDMANGQPNILKAVYDRSTDICRQIYEKPICDETSYMNMYRKSQKMFNNRQLYALKELYMWRDVTARQEDDSTGYVLPNHMLLNIAETLPREMQGILACCNPIPPLVRQNLLKLHKLILKSREQPLIKPVLEQDIRQRLAQRNQAVDSDVWIWSPHDIPSGSEVQANLPCLLDKNKIIEKIPDNSKIQHCVTVFDSPKYSDDDNTIAHDKLKKARTLFVSPFERYKLVIPMVAAQEEEERAKKDKEEKEKAEVAARLAKKEEDETAQSIERVHNFYLQVSKEQLINAKVESSEPGNKKRKRKSDSNDCKIVNSPIQKSPVVTNTPLQRFKRKRKNNEQQQQQQKKPKNTPPGTKKGLNCYAGST